jgi:tripeptide aminopeptidase
VKSSIRGGTDGSRLSFMGPPCPNIFAGEQAFHPLQEGGACRTWKKPCRPIVHLAMIWKERA